MAFQAAVGTWFAVHMLVRMPTGGRFGLTPTALTVELRLETGEGLDDILVTQDDGGNIHLQCKTRANLSITGDTPLAKSLGQLAKVVRDAKAQATPVDPTTSTAVLAVGSAAPSSLDHLQAGCRAFDLGGAWTSTKGQRNEAERSALDLFETATKGSWITPTGSAASDADIVAMARFFRIERFTMDEGDSDWREASRLLGERLYGGAEHGDAPLRELKAIVRAMIASGAPADRDGLLRELRTRGHQDTGSPGFESDVERLRGVTAREMARLARHAHLGIGAGVMIRRECEAPMRAALATGSMLVIGEPGAGKTGALLAMAQELIAAADTIVLLSVDMYQGVAITTDLDAELELTHPLLDVLAAFPGIGRKILFLDALDAARGGSAEGVFAKIIEDATARLSGDWSVVASIRTFDLKNGRRYAEALLGAPPDPSYADKRLSGIRHFLVPALTEADLEAAGDLSPDLGALIDAAPDKLRHLLHNVFNLSLAAKLLAGGADPESIRTVQTQSDLVDAYEDARLTTTQLKRAASATVAAMAVRRRLTVRKVGVETDHLDDVIQTGVLVETGDLVAFAHHVLFDHVAGRFHLKLDDPDALLDQIAGDASTALMLAPALRFAVERLWRSDAGRRAAWKMVIDIHARDDLDPVLANVALRTLVDGVALLTDIEALIALVAVRRDEPALATMLSRLARFVGLQANAAGTIEPGAAQAWATVAEHATTIGVRGLLDAAWFLLQTLFDKADLSELALAATFGRAARGLLSAAWAEDQPVAVPTRNAIRFVGKSFASDPAASRDLLDLILREPHFSRSADQEAPWLAEQILPIAKADPVFAAEIYRVLHLQKIDVDEKSWLGGRPSAILPLVSNRRQDYEHARWQLGHEARGFLEISPEHGTRAVIDASLCHDRSRDIADRITLTNGNALELRGREITIQHWDEPVENAPARDDDALAHYVAFLRVCSVEQFSASVAAASHLYASGAVWARIFGVGAERAEETSALLWIHATNIGFLSHADTLREAVRLLAAIYGTQPSEDREAFEEAIAVRLRGDDGVENGRWRGILSRWLSSVSESDLATDAMRTLRAEMDAAQELRGNEPEFLLTRISYEDRNATREWLAGEGIAIDLAPNRNALDARDMLVDVVSRTSTPRAASDVTRTWTAIAAAVALIDANNGVIDEWVVKSLWREVGRAVEFVAGSESYDPAIDNHPAVDDLDALLQRLADPERRTTAMNRDQPDIRAHAAAGWMSLVRRFSSDFPTIVDGVERMASDPSPLVRSEIVLDLPALFADFPDRMWAIAERFSVEETEDAVLAAFLGRSIPNLCRFAPERCETIVGAMIDRSAFLPSSRSPLQGDLQRVLGSLAVQLWIGMNRATARDWLFAWARDAATHRETIESFVTNLRNVFFARYHHADTATQAMTDRAQQSIEVILRECLDQKAAGIEILQEQALPAAIKDHGRLSVQASEQIIFHAASTFYFGSGAYSGQPESEIGLTSPGTMAAFLTDYATVLAELSRSGSAATIHKLIEIYEYIVPGDPANVFDAVHALVMGKGMEGGYHYESLGSTSVVRLVSRYIADHRPIFEDETRRKHLIDILRLFSDVGWSDALNLLYDLPDLIR